MDIEELNTTQIILLALLVSFVTSIATGIVTVSLLAQAPPGVTQTINHIVERTVETITPSDNKPVTTKETTVVVKEDDLITASISDSLGKTGRIYQGVSTTSPIVGLGAAFSSGIIVTDSSIVDGEHLVSVGNTTAVFKVAQTFPEIGIAVLVPKATSTALTSSFKITDTTALKLGQTSVAIVSVTSEKVAIGSINSRSPFAEVLRKDGLKILVRSVDTNINASLVPGTPLVNIFGDLIGVSTAVSEAQNGNGSFIAASDISTLITTKATSTPSN